MGTQLGIWRPGGLGPSAAWFNGASTALSSIHSDGPGFTSRRGIAVASACLEVDSYEDTDRSGFLLWDGRLDNRKELLAWLAGEVRPEAPNAEVVSAAFRRWNTNAFARLLGDWSLTLWLPEEQTLLFAKDPIGTKPLYFLRLDGDLHWSSDLNLLTSLLGSSPALSDEYIAGWLSLFPRSDLTPYVAIHAVEPSTFYQFRAGEQTSVRYWDFSANKTIDAKTDAELDESFRESLRVSVKRRLSASGPVLAELSGGMDSSSIVCVADTLGAEFDTVSYYDDAEPHWNEKPYFTRVEEQRGKGGIHVPIDAGDDLHAVFEADFTPATPAEYGKTSTRHRELMRLARERGYVAVLSGTGGDEFTGGVPTPLPELSDELASGRLFQLIRKTNAWSLSQRRPWTHLLAETIFGFFPSNFGGATYSRPVAPWLTPKFTHDQHDALNGYSRRLSLFGPRPSFQENASTLNLVRRQLACSHFNASSPLEKRYPYLDRDLLEFLFALQRDLLIQPGRRRLLMRRALSGVVPEEIIQRKRKAYVVRAPRMAIIEHWDFVQTLASDMVSESLGILSASSFRQQLEDTRAGKDVPIQSIIRTLVLEKWLRALSGKISEIATSPDRSKSALALRSARVA